MDEVRERERELDSRRQSRLRRRQMLENNINQGNGNRNGNGITQPDDPMIIDDPDPMIIDDPMIIENQRVEQRNPITVELAPGEQPDPGVQLRVLNRVMDNNIQPMGRRETAQEGLLAALRNMQNTDQINGGKKRKSKRKKSKRKSKKSKRKSKKPKRKSKKLKRKTKSRKK